MVYFIGHAACFPSFSAQPVNNNMTVTYCVKFELCLFVHEKSCSTVHRHPCTRAVNRFCPSRFFTLFDEGKDGPAALPERNGSMYIVCVCIAVVIIFVATIVFILFPSYLSCPGGLYIMALNMSNPSMVMSIYSSILNNEYNW